LPDYETLEWVYNEADIDGARIVFARDMGADKNRELTHYYPERRVWRVVVKPDRSFELTPENAP
jgi:hypothetical protein